LNQYRARAPIEASSRKKDMGKKGERRNRETTESDSQKEVEEGGRNKTRRVSIFEQLSWWVGEKGGKRTSALEMPREK